MKENVIIGKLIPAGTGYDERKRYEESKRIAAEQPEIDLASVTTSLLIDDNTDESVLEAMITAAAETRAKEVAASMAFATGQFEEGGDEPFQADLDEIDTLLPIEDEVQEGIVESGEMQEEDPAEELQEELSEEQ